jgi:hypothetical protein
MNKRIKNILAILVISFPVLMMVSCEKDINEGDDFISGKWRDSTVEDTNSTIEQLLSYTEYAPYNYEYSKRTAINYICSIVQGDEDSIFDTIYTPQKGNYTISGDTLTVVDYMSRTNVYFLQKVNKDTMIYLDSKGKVYKYYRYKR